MEAGKELRITFVGMLFALAIGKMATDLGTFYITTPNPLKYPHIITHFVLVTYILTSSWVGWQMSKSSGTSKTIQTVFDLQYLILLIDVALVVCYFIIVLGVDSVKNDPSAIIETKWSFIVFAIYLLWDVITKGISSEKKKVGESTKKVIVLGSSQFRNRVGITIVCVLLCGLTWCVMGNSETSMEVVLADVSLLSIFVLFRGFKDKKEKTIEGVDQGIFYHIRRWVSRYIPIIVLIICFVWFLLI